MDFELLHKRDKKKKKTKEITNNGYRNAGFFIYMDLSPYLPSPEEISNTNEREFALAKKFLDAGVFIHPGEEHGKLPGWFRLVYSHEEQVLQEGLRR